MNDWEPVKNRSELQRRLLVKIYCDECATWHMGLISGAPIVKVHRHHRQQCSDPLHPIQSIDLCRCTDVSTVDVCIADDEFGIGKILRLADRHLDTETVDAERVMEASTPR